MYSSLAFKDVQVLKGLNYEKLILKFLNYTHIFLQILLRAIAICGYMCPFAPFFSKSTEHLQNLTLTAFVHYLRNSLLDL